MPRKQNGFGKAKSLAFKPSKGVNKGKAQGAAGYYPSNRRYGTSVHRSVIESYNLNSDWVKWRKGYEYYNQSAWYRLEEQNPNTLDYEVRNVESVLFEGTQYETLVTFDGYKFATNTSDSNNHYVMKRTPIGKPTGSSSLDNPSSITGYVPLDLGKIKQGSVRNDFYYNFDYKNKEYLDHKARKEIWVEINPGEDTLVLSQMVGERVTDGISEATITYILNDKKEPVVYIGKSMTADGQRPGIIYTGDGIQQVDVKENLTTVKLTIPESDLIIEPEYEATIEEINTDLINILVDKVVYIPTLFTLRPNGEPTLNVTYIDGADYFGVDLTDTITVNNIQILDASAEPLPPSLYDISQLASIAIASSGKAEVNGTFIYQKDLYQRFFGNQYLTSQVVEKEITSLTYNILPYRVLGVARIGTNIVLTSVPAVTELKLYSSPPETLVLTDYSFTKTKVDGYPYRGTENEKDPYKYYYEDPETHEEMVYYHELDPDKPLWRCIDTDVNPWTDETFTTGNPLQPATVYSCSCPNHSHSLLSAPQSTEDEGLRKINRQRRYPLPTVLGQSDFDAIGKNKAAGKIESWETREHRMSFKMCKHSIATMFIDRLKVKEPNSYPTQDARDRFEAQLKEEIEQIGSKFEQSYKRGGITTLEVIFALAQGLNLDDVELAYVILNSNF
jgi:hypothetical protein